MKNKFATAALVGVALSLAAAPALAGCGLDKLAELPVTMSGLRPMVPAKINGQQVEFIADSGAFFSMITPATAAALKLKLELSPVLMGIYGVGGSARASVTTVKTFTLAGADIPNVQFIVASDVGNDAAGLMGQNVLRLADVEYDFANGVIRLMRPHGCSQATLAYWADNISYSVLDIMPTEPTAPHTIGYVVVNGVRVRTIFDTGAPVSEISREAAARAGVKIDDPDVVPAGPSYGLGPHAVQTWRGRFNLIKVGDEEIRNSRLGISDTGFNGADMLIGADFFLSHRVYVSNSQSKLYFTYNGGPIFDRTTKTMAITAQDQAPQAAPVLDEGRPEPVDAEGFSRRGAAFASRGDFDKAIADFSRAIDLAPRESRFFYQRATAKLGGHQSETAVADLDQAIKLDPGNIPALVARAALRFASKDKAGASADLDAVDKLVAKDADVRLELAVLYQGADLLDAAIAQYGLWIDTHADNGRLGGTLNDRCWARALAGHDLAKALDDCNRAVRLGPKTAAFLDSRGLVHLRMGDFSQSIADYNAALALRPKGAWSLYGRGLAKIRSGMKADGQVDIAAAVAITPDLPDQMKKYAIADGTQ